MFLVNGNPENRLEISDRGLQYGDGLFETIAYQHQQPQHLIAHLERLAIGCQRLAIPCPSFDLFINDIDQLALDQNPAVVKIIVTRGCGGRGYRQPDSIQPTRIISQHPFPDYPVSYIQQGIAAFFCKTRLSINPLLAGMKHLNRLEQVLARAEWSDSTFQEGIMMDSLDRVIEGTMSNLFFIKQSILYTAPLRDSGVAGIMRALVIQYAQAHQIKIQEVYYDRAQLLAADEIFVTNSIIGIWPVSLLDNQLLAVGPITQTLMHGLTQS